MLNLEDVHEFIYENCENVTTSKHGLHFHARCPLCMDSQKSAIKKRFHIEYGDDNCKYHCFNCEQSGDFYTLYSILKGLDKTEAWKKYHNFNDVESIWKHHKPIPTEQKLPQQNCNWIKSFCLSVNDEPDGYIQSKYIDILRQFIDDRKISINVLIAYNGPFKDRIIIPIYDGDDIVYFQGRSIDGSDPKYLNPSIEKQDIIFNKDNFIDGPIFITEGILDAQSIGHNGTCCLGREITDDFLAKLYSYSDDLIIVLDNDQAGMDSLKKIFKESMYKNKLRYFLMPKYYKNMNDINKLDMSSDVDVDKFIIENSYSLWKAAIKLEMEMWRHETNGNWQGHYNSRRGEQHRVM